MVKKILASSARHTRVGFFIASFLLFVSYILTFILTRQLSVQDRWMNHTNEAIHRLDNINGYISKTESAYRGYIITQNQKYLASYAEDVKKTDSTISDLQGFTQDNIVQQENVTALKKLIDRRFRDLEDSALNPTHENKILSLELEGNSALTKEIEGEINKMKQEELSLRNERSKRVSQYSQILLFFDVVSVAIAIVLIIYSAILYNKERKEKKTVAAKAEKYKEQLKQRVDELAKLNTELIELRRLEKYMVTGRIARVMAHEVRNPLTNINLACEQLRAEVEDEDSEIFFTMIRRNSERINQLVSDLLATTRTQLTLSHASVNEILDASLELAIDRIKLNNIQVVKNYDDNLCSLPVDIEKIKIAFLNIIVNAIEAMDENGKLEISTTNRDGKCVVKITDNGKGMNQTEVDRLFEPYFTTKEKGNGLGLANSQNIIINHKGSISAESELGKGTSFTISFSTDDA